MLLYPSVAALWALEKSKPLKNCTNKQKIKPTLGNEVKSLCQAKSLCKYGLLRGFIQLQKAGSAREVLMENTAQIQLQLSCCLEALGPSESTFKLHPTSKLLVLKPECAVA